MFLVPYHFGMEIRQLRYLVALAQDLSFTKAAARANVAQPALSRQIRRLEDELGTALVDRTSRRVRMTNAGEQLVERARLILDEVERARADVGQIAGLTHGRIALGTTQTPGPLDVAGVLYEFHTQHPGIELTVREELSISVAERIRADEIDIGFVSEIPHPARHGLEMRQVASEPLVLALQTSHRLAAHAEISIHDLESESFIIFPEGATIRSTFDLLVARAGIAPNIAFITTDTDRMRELVTLGLGIALLPASDASRPGHIHATAVIRDQPLTYDVYLAWRGNRRQSPAAAAMARLVDTTYSGYSGQPTLEHRGAAATPESC